MPTEPPLKPLEPQPTLFQVQEAQGLAPERLPTRLQMRQSMQQLRSKLVALLQKGWKLMFSIPFGVRMWLTKWWPALLAGVVIIAAIVTIYLRGVSAGKSGEQVKAAEREAEVQVQVNDANQNAADARVEGEVKLEQQKRELEDAQRDAKNLDDLRRKRGCVILRQQGRDTSSIPACR